jgi:hypothetical protein
MNEALGLGDAKDMGNPEPSRCSGASLQKKELSKVDKRILKGRPLE